MTAAFPVFADEIDVAALIEAHNRVRAENKLPPLKPSSQLALAAQEHARDMASHHLAGHEGSDGSDPFTRIKRHGYGYQSAGENVADGQESIAEVMNVWITSAEHRKDILGDYTEIGASMVRDPGRHTYWCVVFGRPWPKLDPAQAPRLLIAALNKARVVAHRAKVREDRALTEVAGTFVRESASNGKLTTTNRDGESPFDVLKRQGYRARQIAFSVASGHGEPEEIVHSWLERKEDREVLLGRFDRAGGAAAAAKDGTPFWVIVMAKP